MLEQDQFRCNSSSLLSYLEKLGIVEASKPKEVHFSEIGYRKLLKEYLDPDPVVYEYELVSEFPLWVFTLI
jgi:hypothetical protein